MWFFRGSQTRARRHTHSTNRLFGDRGNIRLRLETLESRTLLSISSTVSAVASQTEESAAYTAAAITGDTSATTTSSTASVASAAAVASSSSTTATATTTVHLTAEWFAQQGAGPYYLNASNTTYVLDTDVTVSGTAFILGGSNVTLDLNQHTVTYGNSTPVTVTNGGFEQGSGTSVPGWDLSSAPSAAIAANTDYFWGDQVLKFTNATGTQSILSDAISIPTANHEYAATISWKTVNGSTVTLSVVDATTGAVLASSTEGVVKFTPTTTASVRLKITVTATTADTVTLDYASLTASRDYGVIASTAWYYLPSQLSSDTTKSTMTNSQYLTICNGSIVQGQGDGYSSLPIYAEYVNGLTVKNVNTLSTGIDTGAIDARYASLGVTISGCVFRSTSDKVTNRMAMMGALVQVPYSTDPVVVTDNQFYDSPQIGIFASGNDDLTISNNTIESNTIVTDGYGILLNNVHHFVISGNTITAAVGKSSRGILIDGYSGVTDDGEIYDNYIDIRERPNSEYGVTGLEATALRLRTWEDAGWTNLHIYNNTFIARTGVGEVHEAIGLRVYIPTNSTGADLNNVIESNTFKAIVETTDASYSAYAVTIEGVGANCCPLFVDNLFESNDTSLGLGGNDGKDAFDGNFISNTFVRSSEGATRTYSAISAGFWIGSVQNITIIDSQYSNGATQTINWASSYAPSDGSTRQVSFGWLLDINAEDASGNALAGATVTITDNTGATVYTGTTNASGQLADIPLVTTTYSQSTTNSSTITAVGWGPFNVTVSLAGYASTTQTVNLTQSSTIDVQLSGSGTTVTVTAPSGLTANASSASVALAWTNNATNATAFSVERSTGTSGVWTVLTNSLAATATSYTDSAVTAGTTYSYRVRALAGSTASGYSNVASATVPSATPTTPAAPTNLTATAVVSPGGIQLTWTNNATNATSYSVERYSGGTGLWAVVASNLAATATSYTDTSVTAGTFYTYRVQALAGTIASNYSNTAWATAPAATTTTLAAPTNLTATAASSASVTLAWTNNATNATAYSVERSTGTSGVWTVLTSSLAATATSYTDNTVTAGTTYSYRVQAFAGTTASAYSATASVTVPVTTPATPTNLTATAITSSVGIQLTWTNNATNATSYSVERYSGGTGLWAVVASNLAATATSYTDTSVTAGTFYTYRVQALAGTVASNYSNTAWATATTTTLATPTNLTATAATSSVSIQLAWTNNATGATAYTVERYSGGTGLWAVVASNLAATATSYTDTSVTAGTFYTYRVKATAGSAASSYSNTAWATAPTATILVAPTNLKAVAIASSGGIRLTWTNNATGVTSFRVERYSGGTGLWTVVASNVSGLATSYVDLSVTAGTFYTYRVQAVAGSVTSAYSNTAWATAPKKTSAVKSSSVTAASTTTVVSLNPVAVAAVFSLDTSDDGATSSDLNAILPTEG
ncbi:MAG: fibronectin type III domain-containing protein [Thermoguttaceae bacterium]